MDSCCSYLSHREVMIVSPSLIEQEWISMKETLWNDFESEKQAILDKYKEKYKEITMSTQEKLTEKLKLERKRLLRHTNKSLSMGANYIESMMWKLQKEVPEQWEFLESIIKELRIITVENQERVAIDIEDAITQCHKDRGELYQKQQKRFLDEYQKKKSHLEETFKDLQMQLQLEQNDYLDSIQNQLQKLKSYHQQLNKEIVGEKTTELNSKLIVLKSKCDEMNGEKEKLSSKYECLLIKYKYALELHQKIFQSQKNFRMLMTNVTEAEAEKEINKSM